MTSLAHVRFKVDVRERDVIVCLGEILMQVKQQQKNNRKLYCKKTANSPLTFPWLNACSVTLTDFIRQTELSVHRLVSVKNATFCLS